MVKREGKGTEMRKKEEQAGAMLQVCHLHQTFIFILLLFLLLLFAACLRLQFPSPVLPHTPHTAITHTTHTNTPESHTHTHTPQPQAAVRRSIIMPLIAAKASRQFEAAARRIEGRAWQPFAARSVRAPFQNKFATPSIVEFSTAPDASEHPGSSLLDDHDASIRDISLMTERGIDEAYRRVQRLEELAAAMDTQSCQASMDIGNAGDSAAGQGPVSLKPHGLGESESEHASQGCDISLDSLSASTCLSLSAIWDHDQSLCLTDDDTTGDSERHALSHNESLEDDSSHANSHDLEKCEQDTPPPAEGKNFGGVNDWNTPPHAQALVATHHRSPLNASQLSAGGTPGMSQTTTPLNVCKEHLLQSAGCDASLKTGEASRNDGALKNQRRLLLQQELLWAKQVLSIRKQQLKDSRLASF